MPKPGPPRAISRFIVMAMLQAARAKHLGLPTESAYSWGLNRAIFFAAAKQGFKSGGGGEGEGRGGVPAGHPGREEYHLGNELAYRDTSRPGIWFTIGEETQTAEEFAHQIESRFVNRAHFAEAWKEAEAVVAAADRSSLESGSDFFARVYKPRRDSLRAKWSAMIGAPPPTSPR